MIDSSFWKNKKVFITGHTGFKGSWLCLLLHLLDARITGYSLNPPTNPNLFTLTDISALPNTKTIINDIRDLAQLKHALVQSEPEIVIHMAAQPLVKLSYQQPVETYATNVMGTIHVLEAIRSCSSVKAVVIVTSDKCYENKEWYWGYRETESLGGYDPYSNSKGCAELVTNAYRQSFFNPSTYSSHGVAIASARAGNVIGGGDWALDRLIPDCMNALTKGNEIIIRSPHAIRPWQHVLEPLHGYLLLAQKLFTDGPTFAEPWNFGPQQNDCQQVIDVVKKICTLWSQNARYKIIENTQHHEATFLKLDFSKSLMRLNWNPVWNIDTTVSKTVEWYKMFVRGNKLQSFTLDQIQAFLADI